MGVATVGGHAGKLLSSEIRNFACRRRPDARNGSTLRFTALLHHIDVRLLFESFDHLKKSAALGIDGVTWSDYEADVEANLADLHDRIHRGAGRAKPSRRTWIPKPDGRQRPLGVASLEDKIVQQAVLWVLQCIYTESGTDASCD